ncbi:related to transposase [Sporisorium scitamineum]|uniref:Related to transposase n=1 Tax=Sporisorium scitamineum TaxID=49012 RepID=A0A140KLV1_9BASI|nr:related to transposase [Sporisorium scitamineum]
MDETGFIQVIPPLIITVGDARRMVDIPGSWTFSKSNNAWTHNKLAVQWLVNVLDPSTTPSTPSEWCLLILDGHRLHTLMKFCNTLCPLTSYRRLVSATATHLDKVNRALPCLVYLFFGKLDTLICPNGEKGPAHHHQGANQPDPLPPCGFPTFYAQARKKVLTQSAVRKAFSDCSITIKPSLEASNEVLEAENAVLQIDSKRRKLASKKAGKKVAAGDQRRLSKVVMITCKHALRELVAVLPPMAAVDDGEDAEEDGDECLLALLTVSTTPAVPDIDPNLDNGEPLDAICDDNEVPFAFFETLPAAVSSRTSFK